MKRLPPHMLEIYSSARRFKAGARARAKHVNRALNELQLGCAFFPNGSEGVRRIRVALEKVIADISVKNWGR